VGEHEPGSADLLLQVALGDEAVAAEAWRRWCARFPLDDIDWSSFLVLPAAYANLVAHGITTDLAPRLRGVVRREWVANQVVGRALDDLLGSLAGEGIRTVEVGGRARSRYHGEPTTRSMTDAGVLVRPSDGAAALACLGRRGWTPLPASPKRRQRQRRAALVDVAGTTVTLQWAVLGPEHDGGDDGRFWERAGDRTLAPADELLQTVVHGLHHLTPGPLWRLDAAMIARSGDVDWATFATEADRIGLLAARSSIRGLWSRYARQARVRHDRPAVVGFGAWLVANYDVAAVVDGVRRRLPGAAGGR
jgi:hypothetical protein